MYLRKFENINRNKIVNKCINDLELFKAFFFNYKFFTNEELIKLCENKDIFNILIKYYNVNSFELYNILNKNK